MGSGLGAQRRYAAHSVLASGNWYKIGVVEAGVYKVDINLLNTLGLNTGNLSSASIRLYGNGGAMLNESNASQPLDDLVENAIDMNDGGDGVFNGNDFFLFYAPGTDRWEKDSLNQLFRFRKNLYADTSWFYLSIGGTGKRMHTAPSAPNPTTTVSSFDEHLAYEKDLVNLLGSGKEWWGEAFGSPNPNNRSFAVEIPGLIVSEPVRLRSTLASRSVGAVGSFAVAINNNRVFTASLPGVSGSFLDRYAQSGEWQGAVTVTDGKLGIGFDYQSNAAGAMGWLNRWELFARRTLSKINDQVLWFRDWRSVGNGRVAEFQVGGAVAGVQVWEITRLQDPIRIASLNDGSSLRFARDASQLREYIAFSQQQIRLPFAGGQLLNQDLHAQAAVDYVMITHPDLQSAAARLAQFHRQRGLSVAVVNTNQVYQEFSGGIPDPTALRDFVKMLYDRAGNDSSLRPKYLLLLGAGSYDYRYRINPNSNLVPAWESPESLDPLSSITSDDFFALLDDTDAIENASANTVLDIAVGRLPARNLAEANTLIDKIIRYHQSGSLGDWRTRLLFVADDKDNNLHLLDAESVTRAVAEVNPLPGVQKLYLDAFPLVSGSGGARYPAVNESLVNELNKGALVLNYNGHGNYLRLADEAVFTRDEVIRLRNPHRLPLVVTASCDFYPFDDPLKNSVGEDMLSGDSSGAIGLLTTARLVFAYSNRMINDHFLRMLFSRSGNQYLTIGEAVRRAKNLTLSSNGGILNTQKFVLLGDPALRLALPSNGIRLTALNQTAISGRDTLYATRKYELQGEVLDASGNLQTSFNGSLYPTIYDQPSLVKTRGNDVSSPVTPFSQQTSVLYKGVVTVQNGRFRFSFVMPRDISFQAGKAKISLYAENGLTDAVGVDTSFFTMGTAADPTDQRGPDIALFLNDSLFQQGGITGSAPVLLARLQDSSGINTSGNSIGHDITLVIDGNTRDVRVLNADYQSGRDDYRKGSIRYQLPTLAPGKHYLVLKAWDLVNNASEKRLDFVVTKEDQLVVSALRNFPNPFTNLTRFSFEHNQLGADLQVKIYISHINGRLVKRLSKNVTAGGNRFVQLDWDGRDESGRKTEKGVYIYHVEVTTTTGRFSQSGQLILL
jgi:hypothetical protein